MNKRRFPPKKATKKQIEFTHKLYAPQPVLSADEIAEMPDDPTLKQRKKRVELESKHHSHFVIKFGERWLDVYVFSIRDERDMYKESERNKQRGKKRPDIFIAKTVMKRVRKSNLNLDFIYYNYAGLFIEMKSSRDKYLTKKGTIRMSKHIQGQLETLMKLREKGYAAYFAGDEAEAMIIAEWYMEGDGLCPYEYLYTGCPKCKGTKFYHCNGCDYVYCENCYLDIIHDSCGECVPF